MQDADYRRLVEDSPLATLVVKDARVVWANSAAHRLLRVEQALDGAELFRFVHPEDRADVLGVLSSEAVADPSLERVPHEWRLVTGRDEDVTVEVLLAPVQHEGERGMHVVCWDVSLHVARQRDLAHRATHDRLTGLPNRSLLEDRWHQARSRARRTGLAPLVLFCDVDDLKQVNDRYGHVVGDAALVEVAARLRHASRGEDTVARFGGDEFVLLVESPADVEADLLADRLRATLAGVEVPLGDGREALVVRSSVGHVVDDLTRSTAEVLAVADARMYEQKRRSRS
ncbi:diguanylate cyclase [Kineococcus sp. R8]|uniref:diguanylate cyclase domain-containing protein n=1 Tax=Kineococcus siccus TaxID=2696567 RepID=UPI00141205FB|nr:diguanylate cyclase [Kineococcus siccus]